MPGFLRLAVSGAAAILPAAHPMKPAQMVVSLILLLPLSLALVAPKKVTLQWYAAGW